MTIMSLDCYALLVINSGSLAIYIFAQTLSRLSILRAGSKNFTITPHEAYARRYYFDTFARLLPDTRRDELDH